ncbi:MAG TPA: hypothetical protein VIK37_03370 [Candidatus Saccharimonadales bacterium]
MTVDQEQSERLKRVIKYALVAGLGAAAVYNVHKGDKRGHLRPTESRGHFFMTVIQDGRDKINQITGALSDFETAIRGGEVEIVIDEHVQPSEDDIIELETIFIGETGDQPPQTT